MPEPWIALYDGPDEAADALRSLDELGIEGVRLISPAAYPAVHMTGRPGPWRLMSWLALIGGFLGLATAIALEVGSSVAHPFDVGGKPVVAWIPYGVVMFELTMLGAGVTSFCSLIVLAFLSRLRVPKAARRAVAGDRLAIVLPAIAGERSDAVCAALAGASAQEGAP